MNLATIAPTTVLRCCQSSGRARSPTTRRILPTCSLTSRRRRGPDLSRPGQCRERLNGVPEGTPRATRPGESERGADQKYFPNAGRFAGRVKARMTAQVPVVLSAPGWPSLGPGSRSPLSSSGNQANRPLYMGSVRY
jgi:hypothetical protein